MMKNRKMIASTLTALCLSASLVVPAFAAEPENAATALETETVSVLEEGLKDGLKNGLKNGFVNGLANGAANGLKNGLRNGLAEGLKNGELRSN